MSDISPFDETPARRPTLADLGGGQKVDGPVRPDPVTMITSHDANEWGLVGAAIAAVCPLAIIVVTQTAGVYAVTGARAPGLGVIGGTFTVTKNNTGDVTLSWAAGALPGTIAAGFSLQNGAGDYGAEATLPNATSFRIKVKDGTSTSQESSFTAFIF